MGNGPLGIITPETALLSRAKNTGTIPAEVPSLRNRTGNFFVAVAV